MKLLKPKKIISLDNLFDSYSLLLSAKHLKIQIVGVSHGLVSYWHRGIMGSKHFNNKNNQLRFDKYFIWDDKMMRMMIKKGCLYNENEIALSGWLRKIKKIDITPNKDNQKKLVLYPYEWLANHKLMQAIIKKISEKNFNVIIKKHPEVEHYSNLKFPNCYFVDDYNDSHYQDAKLIIGSTTTMIFEISHLGIPIIIIEDDGFNMFKGIMHQDWNSTIEINKYLDKNINLKKSNRSSPITESFKSLFNNI